MEGNLERLNRLMRVVGGRKDRVVGCKPWVQGRGRALLDRGRWWLRMLMGGDLMGVLVARVRLRFHYRRAVMGWVWKCNETTNKIKRRLGTHCSGPHDELYVPIAAGGP